ncbi:MAG: phosphoribosylanthranilate isomerase [bacterium]|nr:phosphoribosylanthranilate isomerase [bacterium]
MFIKVCGIRNIRDLEYLKILKVDFFGINFYPKSPRFVGFNLAKKLVENAGNVKPVAITVNLDFEAILEIYKKTEITWFQLHGDEPQELIDKMKKFGFNVIKTLRIKEEQQLKRYKNVDFHLLDVYDPRYGGTGMTLNWIVLSKINIPRPFFIAGGLKPENVFEAISSLKPDGVDVCSGVEKRPGAKDYKKLKSFVEIVRRF